MRQAASALRRPVKAPVAAWVRCALIGVVLVSLIACRGAPPRTPSPEAAPPQPTAPPAAQAPAPTPAGTTAPLRLLRVEPVRGFVGDSFTITGEGLPPGKPMEIQWETWAGSYATQAAGYDVLFLERQYTPKQLQLGRVTADAQGRITLAVTVPEDYGEVHDIYAVADGQNLAKGGFRILRRATVVPAEGPVGTPIAITMTGLGWRPFESTVALRYDNVYTGFVTAVTTRGTASFRIRAAGPVGPRVIQLTAASPGLPFLNNQQSGTAHIPYMDLQFTFLVTGDAGLPPVTTEWPDPDRVALLHGTGPMTASAPGVSATLEPAKGPVMSAATLRASGLSPNAEVDVLWDLAGENAAQAAWYQGMPLATATTAQDGSLTVPFRVTEDRGGWLAAKVLQENRLVAWVPFYVERSLVGIRPPRVRAGEQFTVQIKGGGWTELDKGVAITFDNGYVGYACSTTSAGDITVNLVATGAPGTHLIDLYPMVYRQKGSHTPEYWNFELPQLTALQDHPGLAVGYRLPIFRLAIEVTD